MKGLKHYSSYLGIPPKSNDTETRMQHKHSLASLFTGDRSTAGRSSSSSHPSRATTTSSADPPPPPQPQQQPAYTSPASTSDFRWRFLDAASNGKVWWRTVDSMANFILHWQTRFHEHGDMFGSCLLDVQRAEGEGAACELSRAGLREAVRRLRFEHPSVALRLAKRAALGIEPLRNIPPLVAQHVDLQVALVYDVVECDADVERWLDDIVVYHLASEERLEDDDEFRTLVAAGTADGVPGRDRLRFHFWPASTQRARVLLEQSHSVSEGIGTLHAFDVLLAAIASVLASPAPRACAWGEEVTRLEPAVQDAIAHPPADWRVSAAERKHVQKHNADRMNGKSTPPNVVDKLGAKVIAITLNGEKSSSSVRRKVVNRPLVSVCRSVASKGDMFPLGLLPQTGRPFAGARTHTAFITHTLAPAQTQALLSVLKRKGVTMAPFIEACGHMATMWVRRQRGLAGKGGRDSDTRILGSFSNAISKRDTLQPQYRRYLGLCMSGFPTKIAASSARWSSRAEEGATPSPTDARDPLPAIGPGELDQLFSITSDLAAQYAAARSNANWLKHDQALLFDTMTTEYLFLRDAANYPAIPWLSSVGRVESAFRPHHPTAHAGALHAHKLRLVGRVAIRQPILHVYTFRMHTTLQLSYADWLYADQARQNILCFWMQVVSALIDAVLQQADVSG
ncbi:hypothetical protein sr16360 [Sporisorium reilianum SRZ2]|uniref:Uncharacterized protein n=1 Tax=Sporisorium reilianum (strain SRZ2) TaxID=999809 RepID=E6ZSE8_SPORE|nr:hypothetical protein sr16360 [Sporisorium reilianum SRZ2]